jgi:hypothetical protein
MGALVHAAALGYSLRMFAKAIVQGKVVKFRLSPALARAQKRHAGKTLSDAEAIKLVEKKRRAATLRAAQPYL